MAKSIRSKWKRKMRAVKRERYGKKELERLKKTLSITESGSSLSTTGMVDVSDVVTVTTKEDIVEKKRKAEETSGENAMEVDVAGRKFNSKTLRDQNGTYPIWVHPRKIRKHKKAKKIQQKKNKTKNKNIKN